MARIVTTAISDTECIGDSLTTINTNFENLDTKVQAVSATISGSGTSGAVATAPIGGGTTNKVTKWGSGSALVDSSITDDGTKVTLTSRVDQNLGGLFNTAFGTNALSNITTGYQNVAIGHNTLSMALTCHANTAVGYCALSALRTTVNDQGDNTAIGSESLPDMTDGTNNTALGNQTGRYLRYGKDNVFIGENTGMGNHLTSPGPLLSSTGCIFIGAGTATRTYQADEHPQNCIYIGTNVESTSLENHVVRIGNGSITDNIFNGTICGDMYPPVKAGLPNASFGFANDNNTGIVWLSSGCFRFLSNGAHSGGIYNSAAGSNTSYGVGALTRANAGTNFNTCLGYLSLDACNTGDHNTTVGYKSLSLVTAGSANTCIGSYAGDTIRTGDHNISIGYNSTNAVNVNNTISIGNNMSSINGSNDIVIGNSLNRGVRFGTVDDTFNTGTGTPLEVTVDGYVIRSTSSLRYKTNVEQADKDYSKNIILKSEPIWYRSNTNTTVAENSAWSYWGFAAEQLADVDPRLVVWSYAPEQYELIEKTNERTGVTYTERVVKAGEEKVPDAVQYNRFTVHLVSFAQEQHKEIEELKSTVQQLEARLQALEAK